MSESPAALKSRLPLLTFMSLTTILVSSILLAACGGGDEEPARPQVLLVLGDSIAAGDGASDPAATSFPALVAENGGFDLVNLAETGATADDTLGEQAPQVESAVGDRDVGLIVISAGGNDMATLIPNAACVQDPLPDDCPLDNTLFEISRTLSYVIEDLRAMYEEPRIVLLAYPNFFSGTGHEFEAPASRVLPRFADVMGGVASSYPNWDIVEATPSFDGRGPELTHLLDEPADPHPNDDGHAVIARSVIDAWKN